MSNISSLIPSQLPAYIREEYPTFVKFLESYYEYLELEKNPQDILSNLRQYTDIDDTLDEFIDHFQRQYLQTLPSDLAVNKRLLAKHIQDLYRIKGTEKSYELLFRILFNEDVELYYPKNNILKTSDGKWVQEQSLQIEPTTGDVFSLIGSTIRVQNEYGLIATLVTNVREIKPGKLYEVFISNNYRGTFNIGDTVRGVSFVGKIMPTITNFTIYKPGVKFRPGQIFEITSGGGKGTYVKVTRVDGAGGVTGLSIMTFGSGYVTDFYTTLNNSVPITGAANPYDDSTHGYIESGYITKADYFSEDFATPDFAAKVVGQFGGNMYVPDKSTYNDDETCVVYMRLGPLAKYPGFYKTTDGFLSDANAIQDGEYYQDYSYVIKSQRRLDEYKKFVKDILHPAGMKMFGEYQIVNEFELGDFLEYDKVVLKVLSQMDLYTAVDAVAMTTGKVVDGDMCGVSDSTQLATGKAIADASAALDAIALLMATVYGDTSTTADSASFDVGKAAGDGVTTAEQLVFAMTTLYGDTSTMSDTIAMLFEKVLSDSASALDSTSFGFTSVTGDSAVAVDNAVTLAGSGYGDAATSTDAVALATGRTISGDTATAGDSQPVLNIGKSLPDTVTQVDTGSIILADYANDFAVVDYSNTLIRTF